MKKNSQLRIDFENKRIVMSSKFAKNCQNTDSEEYQKLQRVRQDYPTYTVERKQIAKPKEPKESYKGLTYEYMETYIRLHDSCGEIMKEYKEMQLIAKCHTVQYPRIKQWFLKKFPEIEEFGMPKEEQQEESALVFAAPAETEQSGETFAA